MANITSTLPDDLLKMLSEKSEEFSVPKDKVIEAALRLYLEHLEKLEYIKSFKRAAKDRNVMLMAEEGMSDYLNRLQDGAK